VNSLPPISNPDEAPGGPKFLPQIFRALGTNWLRALLLLVISVAVRAPSLPGEFLWDDKFLAHDSPFIKSPLLALEVFRQHLFPDSFSAHYRPVQNLSYMADYFFWNTNTFGFHLTNLLLHALSAIALYFLLRRLLRSTGRVEWLETNEKLVSSLSFFAALIWAVHPVHSAAVDYISGRADSLAFVFAASGWLLVLRGRETKHSALRCLLFVLAAILGLLALCSRETAALWCLFFVLHTLFFDHQIGRRGKTLAVTACLAIFVAYLGLRHLPPPRAEAGPSEGWSAPVRAVLMLRALGDYGRLMIFPSNLHMERTVVDGNSYRSSATWQNSVANEYLSIAGLIFAALLFAGCRWRGDGRPWRIFGTVWFAIGYLPTSNIVELNATCAEHWLYLPSVGLFVFLAGCVLDLPPRWRKPLPAFACIAVVLLGARSAIRSSDWVTPEIFYERTLAAGGTSIRVATNLAEIYTSQGNYAKAETMLRRVLAIAPDYPTARNNLARALSLEGKTSEAEAIFAQADKAATETRKSYPRTWLAAVNLAHLHHAAGRDVDALVILEKARAEYPEIWEIVSLESELLRQTKGPAPALRLVSDFARNHWWHYGAALALGRLYAETGDANRAAEELRRASWLDVHEVEALNLIARMRIRQHRFTEAYRAQKRAVARQPDAPRQYVLLSDILERMGQTAEARNAIAEVARLEAIGRAEKTAAN
jgi:Flp pilus assembly protein TadD